MSALRVRTSRTASDSASTSPARAPAGDARPAAVMSVTRTDSRPAPGAPSPNPALLPGAAKSLFGKKHRTGGLSMRFSCLSASARASTRVRLVLVVDHEMGQLVRERQPAVLPDPDRGRALMRAMPALHRRCIRIDPPEIEGEGRQVEPPDPDQVTDRTVGVSTPREHGSRPSSSASADVPGRAAPSAGRPAEDGRAPQQRHVAGLASRVRRRWDAPPRDPRRVAPRCRTMADARGVRNHSTRRPSSPAMSRSSSAVTRRSPSRCAPGRGDAQRLGQLRLVQTLRHPRLEDAVPRRHAPCVRF